MCTIAVWFNVWKEAPLVIAANRDEFLGRPADVPRSRIIGGRRCIAPLDREAGGTWMGVNEDELFVGITNRFGGLKDSTLRSRGRLVEAALEYSTALEALRDFRALGSERYNPFHLIVADRRTCGIGVWDGETVRVIENHQGPLVVTERSFGEEVSVRERRLKGRCESLAKGALAPTSTELGELLREHADPGFEGTCVHAEDQGYGTRSSAILRWGPRPLEFTYLATAGAPCMENYRPWEELAGVVLASDGRE